MKERERKNVLDEGQKERERKKERKKEKERNKRNYGKIICHSKEKDKIHKKI